MGCAATPLLASDHAKLYEEATRIVVEDAPGLWIYNTKWYAPYSKNLQGIVFCPIGNLEKAKAELAKAVPCRAAHQLSGSCNGARS